MPDITMCRNSQCPDREICYRFKATPNPNYQSYSYYEFTNEYGCDNFIDLPENKLPVIYPLKFEYKNWKGEVGIRQVIPRNIYYGNTEYHPENQWLMEAVDLDKDNQMRTFAMKDISRFF